MAHQHAYVVKFSLRVNFVGPIIVGNRSGYRKNYTDPNGSGTATLLSEAASDPPPPRICMRFLPALAAAIPLPPFKQLQSVSLSNLMAPRWRS
jgi:hypothetical protein